METYFKNKNGIGTNTECVMRKIAYRYMEENPAAPFSYRAYNTLGFRRGSDGRCILDFDEKFPNAEEGDYAYAFSKLYSENDGICCLSISCRNPNEVFVNGEKVTSTTCLDEVLNDYRMFDFKVHKGYNTIFIKSKKNTLGFKCIIGCYSPKWLPVNFYTAFAENEGELGWNYCGVYKTDCIKTIPTEHSTMGQDWLPKPEKNEIFQTEGPIYAVSFLECGANEITLKCEADTPFTCFIDGEAIFSASKSMEEKLHIKEGTHRISVLFETAPTVFDMGAENAALFLPDFIKGVRGKFLFIETDDERAKNGFDEFLLYGKQDQKEYFKCGKYSYLRPVLERPIFGKSNYPIGVALYGLLRAGRALDDNAIIEYAHSHLLRCCLIMEYAEWDCEKFGSACVNHQLLHLSALDDCGSFASAILEDYMYFKRDDRVLPIVGNVGDYICSRQERLESGAFFREMKGTYFQYTVWADDLYMSTPFLIRYSILKNDPSIMDDAVNQFIQFKKLLFMPDKNLMSHVYNLRFEKQTRVPWGRGNGWALFSLSELLEKLPEDHQHYNEIKVFFEELCEGFFRVMDPEGMCHQVLDDMESYAEASCTAMCAAAFARGVMLGILPRDPFAKAAQKAIQALRKYCIDEDGNIYGVCVGSGYSFTREYYKYDLPWNINDTHGTGIVLIANAEVEKMMK